MAQDSSESTGTPEAAASGYAVGYGKPPLHTRFRKGQSGNPQGRPRRSGQRPVADLAGLLNRALDRPAASAGQGARTQREAIVAALVEKSAAGDLAASRLLFDLMRRLGPAAEPIVAPAADPRELLLERLARLAGERGDRGAE